MMKPNQMPISPELNKKPKIEMMMMMIRMNPPMKISTQTRKKKKMILPMNMTVISVPHLSRKAIQTIVLRKNGKNVRRKRRQERNEAIAKKAR